MASNGSESYVQKLQRMLVDTVVVSGWTFLQTIAPQTRLHNLSSRTTLILEVRAFHRGSCLTWVD